jgi:hypothetical protein
MNCQPATSSHANPPMMDSASAAASSPTTMPTLIVSVSS